MLHAGFTGMRSINQCAMAHSEDFVLVLIHQELNQIMVSAVIPLQITLEGWFTMTLYPCGAQSSVPGLWIRYLRYPEEIFFDVHS